MQRHSEKEGLLRKDSLSGGGGLSILLSFADSYLRYLNRLDVGSNWGECGLGYDAVKA